MLKTNTIFLFHSWAATILCFLFVSCSFGSLRANRLEEHLLFLMPDTNELGQLAERQAVKQAIDQLIAELRAEKVSRKNTSQQILYLAERLERNFQRHYRPTATLADFFQHGQYSDASLAIIQALLLEELALPYVILINHWQPTVLADPAKSKISLHSPLTAQVKGIDQKKFQSEYLELLNLTLVSARRPSSAAETDSLFQQYYYAVKQPITLAQLTAFWHYQAALLAYEEARFDAVIRSLGQAKQRDQRLAFDALEQATYLQLSERNKGSEQLLFYFFEMWDKDPNNPYLPATLLNVFVQATDSLLVRGASFNAGEQLYLFLNKRATNRLLWQNQLRELYYIQKSRYYAAQNRYDLALPFIDSLYISQPNHPLFQQMVGGLSLRAIKASGVSGPALKAQLDQTVNRYPFLLRHPGVRDLLLRDQAMLIRDRYEADLGYQGDNLLAIFRTQLDIATKDERQAIWVLTAYVAASAYYFRLQDYSQARLLIEEALRYAPQDDFLLHRIEVLRRY